MAKTTYTISQAAKVMGVESHVLRFWEEELSLEIPRNEKGYRMYTEETMETLKQIKELKKEHALKEIKELLLQERELGNSQSEGAPSHKECVDQKKQEAFLRIMDRLVAETLKEKKSPEGRYKELDHSIRKHQRARKEVAVSREIQSGKKKKL